MKFIHAADIHLDSPLRGLPDYDGAATDLVRGATRRAFSAMVRLAIAEAVDFVLLAGDLYDGDWRDFNTGLFLVGELAALGAAGIPVFILYGNHDAESRITRSLSLPANVHVFGSRAPESLRRDELGVVLHGQSFRRPDVTENLAADYPAPVPGLFNIGLLHTACDGRPGHGTYAPCTPAELVAKGYDYWALGHVHARDVVHREPWLVYPGNLQGRHIREQGEKGCTLVTVTDGRVTDLVHCPVDVVRWRAVEIAASDCRDLEAVLVALAAALRTTAAESAGRLVAVRLRLVGMTPLHALLAEQQERLTAEARAIGLEIGADALWIEQLELATRPAADPARLAARDDAIGSLLRSLATAPEGELVEALTAELELLSQRFPGDLKPQAEGLMGALAAGDHAALLAAGRDFLVSRLADSENA